jgi:hypothetical protein
MPRSSQDWLGFKTDHPLALPCSRGETHALQLLQPADGEAARLRIALARIVRPQVDEAAVIGHHPDRRVEARPALCFHLLRESGADFMLGPGAELGLQQMHMRVVGWAMPTQSSLVPRSLSIWTARSRVKALRSVISAASCGVTTKRK